MAAVLVVALFLLVYIQSRRYTGPALQLAEYVERIDVQPDMAPPAVPPAWDPLFARVASTARERQALLARAQEHAQELERKVSERTADLTATVKSLQKTQKDLLRSDRLGALGERVASVANELSGSLAKAGEAEQKLHASLQSFEAALKLGLRKAELEAFVAQVGQAGEIVGRNIDEAASLVQRFKQLAVDQVSEQPRHFKLREIAENVLAVMGPAMQRQGCAVSNQVGEDIDLTTYAGTLGQVLTHLFDAAAARVGRRPAGGEIRLSAGWASGERGEMVTLLMADTGVPDAPLAGGPDVQGAASGALDIARRLLEERFGGSVEITSSPEGTQISMQIPRNVG
jgi:C4-dicarboxylate-specific signal transduction histidine kinase